MKAFPNARPSVDSNRKRFWVHASSVGEVKVASVLIAGIRRRFPCSEIFVSTFTDTGFKEAGKINSVQEVSLLPFDFPFLIRPVLQKIRPDFFLSIESEFWPNLLFELKKAGIVSILINGRISEKSFRWYKKVRFLFKAVFFNIDRACMRNKTDAERVVALGMADSKVTITGNMKFDCVLSESKMMVQNSLRKTLQARTGENIIIFGNTRDGEESLLIPVIKRMIDRSHVTVIIAPRHVERIMTIEALLKREKISSIRWTELEVNAKREARQVVLFDVMGKLFQLYGLCSVAFVGGSLLPFGGQNILEPAAFGKPVFFGKFMDNFQEEARMLKESGGGIEVKSAEELSSIIITFLDNPTKRNKHGNAAAEAIKKQGGALEKCLNELAQYMGKN